MRWTEMEGRCTRHPHHRQSRGVCPSCLRDRLTQLSASSSAISSSGSSFDSVSSSVPSSSSSPPHGAAATLPGCAAEPLTKSRSLVFFLAAEKNKNKREEDEREVVGAIEKKKTKKRGFWSRLASGGKNKREKDGLFPSKTVRENSSSGWAHLS